MCSQDLIMKTTRTAGAKEFATDTTDVTGACAVRTLTCTGLNANIEASYFEPFVYIEHPHALFLTMIGEAEFHISDIL